MTPTKQAARWLADVKRYDFLYGDLESSQDGTLCDYDDALAAIARHLAPGDDLVQRLLRVQWSVTGDPCADGNVDETCAHEAAARLSALTAQVAELQAEVAKVTSDRAYIIGANAGWEAAVEQGKATPAAKAVLARINEAEDRIAAVANAAEAENATLRDRLARMEGAVANLPAVYAHQINTGVREVYDPLQRFFTLESVLSALTDGGTE